MSNLSTLLAVLAVLLGVFAVVMVLVGEHLVAGVSLLGVSFVIYLRETRA